MEMSQFMEYQYRLQVSEGMTSLIRMWANNDTLTSYLCFEVGAFKYLLDQLIVNNHNQQTSTFTKLSSLKQIVSINNTTTNQTDNNNSNTNIDDIKPIECANKIVAHNLKHC